jgi:hypothetical protein
MIVPLFLTSIEQTRLSWPANTGHPVETRETLQVESVADLNNAAHDLGGPHLRAMTIKEFIIALRA